MEKNFNLSSLTTVYAPIEEYLKNIKSGLQVNLNTIKNANKVATNFEYIDTLSKMRSVFEMVGLNGLNKVILLVEDGSKGIKEADFITKTSIEILEESINIIKSVEVYIKQLLDGSLDQPTRFFDSYKKLADIIEVDVSIKDLFRPKLEVKEPKLKNELKIGQYLTKANEDEIKNTCSLAVEKIENYIPIILEKISRFNSLNETNDMVEYKNACKVVYDSLTDLQTLKISKSYYVLSGIQKLMLCIAAPFFNESFNSLALGNLDSMKFNIELIQKTAINLNKGIQELKLGKKTSSVKINEEVVTENLFFVINSIIHNQKLKEMPVFKELQSYFDYEFYEEQLSSETIQATITYQNNGLSEQLEEILFSIKEELIIVTGKKHNEDAYNQHLTKFYVLNYKFWEVLKIANGEINFKSFINSIVELSEKIKSKKLDVTEETKKELSISIVWIEYAINNLIKKRIEQKSRIDFEKQLEIQEKRIRKLSAGETVQGMPVPVLDARSKEQEAKKAILKIYEEIEIDLKLAEETLEGILKTNSLEDKDLDVVIKPLNSIKGILLVLGNRDMGELVKELMRIWKCVQQNGLDSIPSDELKKSVVWFAGLSLFVSASKVGNDYKAKEIESKLMFEFKGEPDKVEIKAQELIIPEDNKLQTTTINDVIDIVEEKVIHPAFEAVEEKVIQPILEEYQMIKEEVKPLMEEIKEEVIHPVVETIEEKIVQPVVEEYHMIKDQVVEVVKEKEEAFVNQFKGKAGYETSKAEDDDLKEVFVEELTELVETANSSIKHLTEDPSIEVEIVTLRRVFHTYKGSGRVIGINNIAEVAWVVEQEMNNIISRGNISLTKNQIMALQLVNDKFADWSKELNETGEITISIKDEKDLFLNLFFDKDESDQKVENAIIDDTSYEEKEGDNKSVDDISELSLGSVTYDEQESNNSIQSINVSDVSLNEISYEEKQEEVKTVVDTSDIALGEISYEEKQEEIKTVVDTSDITLGEISYEEKEEIKVVVDTSDIVLGEVSYEEKEEIVNNIDSLKNIDDAIDEIIVPIIPEEYENEEDEIIIPELIEGKVVEEKNEYIHTPATKEVKDIEQDEIYALCQLEIKENLDKLEKITEDLMSQNEQYDFMRFAHTLSSLGKTSGLIDFAEIAHKIELIGEVMLEKHKSLDAENLLKVKNVVRMIRGQSVKENKPNEKDMQKYILTLAEVKASLNEQEVVKSIVIPDELVNLPNTVREIKELVEKHDQEISNIKQSIDFINKDIKELVEKTTSIKRETIGRLKNLKKEVELLKEPVKKKSNGSDFWIFQKIEIEQSGYLFGIEQNLINVISQLQNIELNESDKNSLVLDFEMIINDLEQILLKVEENEITSIETINEEFIVDDKNDIGIGIPVFNLDAVNEKINPSNNEDTNITDVEIKNEDNSLEFNFENIVMKEVSSQEIDIYNDPIVIDIFDEKISVIEDDYSEEIFEIAAEEIKEKKQEIDDIVENTTDDVLDKSINETIKRHLHTLKGNLRMAGLNKMGAITHRLESLLDFAEKRDISLMKIKPILESELVKLKYLENNRDELPKEKEQWLDKLEIQTIKEIKDVDVSSKVVETLTNQSVNQAVIKKEEKQNQSIKLSAQVLDDLFNDAGEMRLTRITVEGTISNHKRHLMDMRAAAKKMSSLLREIEMQAETQIAAKKEVEGEVGSDFDPLEFDRYTRLQELTRFMNEALADFEDGLVDLSNIQKIQENAVIQQTSLTNNILNSIMHVRLISVDTINEKLYRISRNTSKELGKLVRLDIVGERTEIDRFVLEKMFDPLAHILRNCIAHGIEPVEIREALGKDKVGRITLDIKQEGNFIIMTISDDGSGVNVEKVRKKAIEKGLINKNQKLSEEDVIDLIYRSGFSTADEVSQVSGRGVGMDVVKSEILSLGGNIKTTTKQGEGSVFKIVLPVSVATNQVLISTTMGKLIAIPAILIENVISIRESSMSDAYSSGKIKVGNEILPLYYMGHLSGTLNNKQPPQLNPYNIVVVVLHGDERIAVHLDRLETTEEILIKPVGPYFGKIKGLLGATLLGDGRQGLVVNPVLLSDHYNEMLKNESSHLHIKSDKVISVLVVDDANTVRRTSEKILKKHGFDVILSVDGANALEILQEKKPDIILSDIEMPVMNGFELLKNLKMSDNLKSIPVIMITSRTADKHRQMAFDLGCDGFLGKPYIEEELIENINILIKK